MRASIRLVVSLATIAAIALVGCGDTHSTSSASPTDRAHEALVAAPLTGAAARSMVARGGEFGFVFDESPQVLAKISARCATQVDAAKCVQNVREQGAREGLRFLPVDADHVRMESFGQEDGHPEVYIEALFLLGAVDGTKVQVTSVAPMKGSGLPKDQTVFDAVPIEVIDADTIATQDPQKGKLVFRRTR